jgi:hypothetical protein
MYFLVKATVTKYPYMAEPRTFDDTRLVMADDAEQAERKYYRFWEGQNEAYEVTYHLNGVEVLQTIV